MNESAALLMNLSDVAALAHVQRPVVSMWRKRSIGSAQPFPGPVALEGGREVFDADQVAAWLAVTGRGNNRSHVRFAAGRLRSRVIVAVAGIAFLWLRNRRWRPTSTG
ncbi:hypothetical protein [Arthrobacter bambusae]|uniref:hypothetical protein n=1 Tax=Arthrobacter bambusae TaxID=1338426 RepID=UPI0027824081|nr:hypothetical protein [Arthrobacter bambusae]MDQ0212648.1 hypothetical protein [Arthrobacter bambusae]MDQ0237075.1 hypothetical protein [Arthrobacter bambusae]